MVTDGIRIPLTKETQFSRCYHSEKSNTSHYISRFMDGSASITASELKEEWNNWPENVQVDFCQNCNWLSNQPDFPEMLRFIMQHGSAYHWSGIAQSVGSYLPRQEAFDALVNVLHQMKPGSTANITQGISLTKHPDAEPMLRKHLADLWENSKLWDADDFLNWIAFDAITCTAHLIELGASPSDFDGQVRRLSEHICEGNRKSCRGFLSKHYPWLK